MVAVLIVVVIIIVVVVVVVIYHHHYHRLVVVAEVEVENLAGNLIMEMKEKITSTFYEGENKQEEEDDEEEEDESNSCTLLCKSERFLFSDDLVMSVSNEKEKLMQRLKIDYGKQNFQKMFIDPTKGNNHLNVRSLFPGVDQSYKRMKTKLILKILKMQMRIIEQKRQQQQQQQNNNEKNDSCDCNNKGQQQQRKKHRSRDLSSNEPFMDKI